MPATTNKPESPPVTHRARLASLPELRAGIVAAYLSPVPSPKVLATLFRRWNVPNLKSNPAAKRGGVPRFYSVAHIERALRQNSGL